MGKILIDKGLTSDPIRDAIANTYVGQVHIAGSGPEDKTCRECMFYGKDKALRFKHFGHRSDCFRKGELKDGQCHKIWANKAYQLFPHYAKACSFFEQNSNPPVATTEKPNVENEEKLSS